MSHMIGHVQSSRYVSCEIDILAFIFLSSGKAPEEIRYVLSSCEYILSRLEISSIFFTSFPNSTGISLCRVLMI